MTQTIELKGETITLGQLLKLLDLVDGGGDVKRYLHETPPTVNGELEGRRGRKLREGDVVTLQDGSAFIIRFAESK